MNRFDSEELKALRKSAAAINKSDYEVTKRLENAYDRVSLMLEALHDRSSTQTLRDIDDGIEFLIERLGDTQTILRLVLRERELEQKLANLDLNTLHQAIQAEEPGIKERIIAALQQGKRVFDDDDEGDPLAANPDTLKRIEQKQQLESLIDTRYTSEEDLKIKKKEKKKEVVTRRLDETEFRPSKDVMKDMDDEQDLYVKRSL